MDDRRSRNRGSVVSGLRVRSPPRDDRASHRSSGFGRSGPGRVASFAQPQHAIDNTIDDNGSAHVAVSQLNAEVVTLTAEVQKQAAIIERLQ